MARSDLERRAGRFAATIQQLLNGTITDWVSVQAATTAAPDVVAVGPGLSTRARRARPVRLATAGLVQQLFLTVQYRLAMDDEGEHLAVRSSTFGVRSSLDDADVWFHYDFERDKVGYPEAHLQVRRNPEVARQSVAQLAG